MESKCEAWRVWMKINMEWKSQMIAIGMDWGSKSIYDDDEMTNNNRSHTNKD